MAKKKEIIEQTNLAFNFIQKLYLEVSFLVKEIEGQLNEEEESFVIGRPSGYGITTRSSTGLEGNSVNFWLLRKFSVFFVPEENTKFENGLTKTAFDRNQKIIYLRFILQEDDIIEPIVYSGVLSKIHKKATKQADRWFKKIENIMGTVEKNEKRIKQDGNKMSYEDVYMKLNGEWFKNNLFDVNDSKTIQSKIIQPTLALFRNK